MLQITYYRSKCIGCNGCVEAAPERWRISRTDGKSNLINGKEKKGIFTTTVNMAEYEENQQAAANCPMSLIKLKVL